MRTETINIYSFEELSKESKEKAIENIRKSYYEHNDFAEWSIDDCSLFEPSVEELEGIEVEGECMIGNNRKNIYFSTDRNWHLSCHEAMVVNDEDAFYQWLGIEKELQSELSYNIHTSNFRNSDTTIEFEWEDTSNKSEFNDVIDSAIEKFNTHINSVLKKIQADIDYRFTDAAIEEDILANEYEFLEDGTIK